MRTWLIILAGPLIWAFHFFALYGVAEIWGETRFGVALVIGLTLLCFLAVVAVLGFCRRRLGQGPYYLIGLGGAAISLVAVTWQGLPALPL